MFIKYTTNLFKNHALKYFIIALCEVVLLTISLFASCVVMDYASKYNGMQTESRYFVFSFSEIANNNINYANLTNDDIIAIKNAEDNLPLVAEMREKIYDFCEKSPVPVSYLTADITGLEKNSYWLMLNYYPTYDDLVCYFTESYKEYWSLPFEALPTKEQYLNHEKVVILGTGSGNSDYGEYVYSDKQHICFGKNDDEYYVVSELAERPFLYMFFGSEPDYAKLENVRFELKSIPTQLEVEEIENLFKEIVAPNGEVTFSSSPKIKNLLDVRKETSIIVLTALMMLISSFNIMAILKCIIEERKHQYAVFRLCGYSKVGSLTFPLIETLELSSVCSVIACFIIELLKPVIALRYPVIHSMFDFNFYVFYSFGFIVITVILFFAYVIPSLGKSISDELREI